MGEEGNGKMGATGRNGEWEGRKGEGTINAVTDKGGEESSDGQVW